YTWSGPTRTRAGADLVTSRTLPVLIGLGPATSYLATMASALPMMHPGQRWEMTHLDVMLTSGSDFTASNKAEARAAVTAPHSPPGLGGHAGPGPLLRGWPRNSASGNAGRGLRGG